MRIMRIIHGSWFLISDIFRGLISISVCNLVQLKWIQGDCWALVEVWALLSANLVYKSLQPLSYSIERGLYLFPENIHLKGCWKQLNVNTFNHFFYLDNNTILKNLISKLMVWSMICKLSVIFTSDWQILHVWISSLIHDLNSSSACRWLSMEDIALLEIITLDIIVVAKTYKSHLSPLQWALHFL